MKLTVVAEWGRPTVAVNFAQDHCVILDSRENLHWLLLECESYSRRCRVSCGQYCKLKALLIGIYSCPLPISFGGQLESTYYTFQYSCDDWIFFTFPALVLSPNKPKFKVLTKVESEKWILVPTYNALSAVTKCTWHRLALSCSFHAIFSRPAIVSGICQLPHPTEVSEGRCTQLSSCKEGKNVKKNITWKHWGEIIKTFHMCHVILICDVTGLYGWPSLVTYMHVSLSTV